MENFNYSIDAIEQLEEHAIMLKCIGATKTAQAYEWIVTMLKMSQKFILPEGGRIIEIDPSRIGTDIPLEFIKLPYPIVASEYRMDRGKVGDLGVESKKRISLAFEINTESMPDFLRKSISFLDDAGGIGVISIFTAMVTEGNKIFSAGCPVCTWVCYLIQHRMMIIR